MNTIDKIKKEAALLWVRIVSIEREPLGVSVEMIGRLGGWVINGISCGLNAKQAIAFMRRDPRTVSRGIDGMTTATKEGA